MRREIPRVPEKIRPRKSTNIGHKSKNAPGGRRPSGLAPRERADLGWGNPDAGTEVLVALDVGMSPHHPQVGILEEGTREKNGGPVVRERLVGKLHAVEDGRRPVVGVVPELSDPDVASREEVHERESEGEPRQHDEDARAEDEPPPA